MYKIVSGRSVISQLKMSKYFKVDLGKSFMGNSKGELKADLSRQEEFDKFYHNKYNTKIFKTGSIGKIEMYIDNNLYDDIVLFYEDHDFSFKHNTKIMREGGIEKYIGSMIKEIETNYLLKIQADKKAEEELTADQKIHIAQNKIKTNPGAVTYDDIKEILKRKKRFNK